MFEKYSRTGASRNVRMSLRFAFSSPAHVIATFGGSGLLHPAPGTWGPFRALSRGELYEKNTLVVVDSSPAAFLLRL